MKKLLSIIGIFIYFGASAQVEKELATRAEDVMKAGDFVLAIELYNDLIARYPKNDVYLLNRGWSKLNSSGFERGAEDLLGAIELNPKCSRCYIGLAIYTLRTGKTKSALDLANDAIKYNDTASFNYYIRAQIMEAISNFELAEGDYNKAIQLNSTVPDYYYTRGSFLFRQGKTEFAVNDFNKAISMEKNVPDYYFQRGYCLYLLGRLNDALSDLMRAISMDPENGDYYLAKGAIEDAMGSRENSILSYSQAIVKNPENPLAYFNRANSYYELNELDNSCADYTLAYQILKNREGEANVSMSKEIEGMMSNHCDTSLASFYYQRGVLAAGASQYSEAVSWYDKGLLKWPGHPLLNSFKGNALLAQKKYKEAEVVYTKALTATSDIPQDVVKSYVLITQQVDINGYMRTIYSAAYDGRSKARLALNNPEAALVDIDKSIFLGEKIDGYDISKSQVMRANILAKLGRYSDAEDLLNNLISNNKNLAEAYVIRARISLEKAIRNSNKRVKLTHATSPESGMYYLEKPKKLKTGKMDQLLLQSALDDCKTALTLNSNFSEAYFVSGQIKYFTGQKDYCADFLLAQQFGISDAMKLMDNPCTEK